mgnify:CR=1 FL=1
MENIFRVLAKKQQVMKKQKKKQKKKREKSVIAIGKRKRAIARATIRQGRGIVRVNLHPLDVFEPEYARMRIREPLLLAEKIANDNNYYKICVISGEGTRSYYNKLGYKNIHGNGYFMLKNI